MPKARKSVKPSRLKSKKQSRGTPSAGPGTSMPSSFKAMRTAAPSRETDFYAWLLAQADELRVHKPDAIDWEDWPRNSKKWPPEPGMPSPAIWSSYLSIAEIVI
jgi:hypothetical protein